MKAPVRSLTTCAHFLILCGALFLAQGVTPSHRACANATKNTLDTLSAEAISMAGSELGLSDDEVYAAQMVAKALRVIGSFAYKSISNKEHCKLCTYSVCSLRDQILKKLRLPMPLGSICTADKGGCVRKTAFDLPDGWKIILHVAYGSGNTFGEHERDVTAGKENAWSIQPCCIGRKAFYSIPSDKKTLNVFVFNHKTHSALYKVILEARSLPLEGYKGPDLSEALETYLQKIRDLRDQSLEAQLYKDPPLPSSTPLPTAPEA